MHLTLIVDPPGTRRRRSVEMLVIRPATRPSMSIRGKGERRLSLVVLATFAATAPVRNVTLVVPMALRALTTAASWLPTSVSVTR